MQGCWGLLRWGLWQLLRRVHIRSVHDHARCSCGSGLARDAGGAVRWSGRVLKLLLHRVHIRHFLITETMVSLLQRVPFERTQKELKGPCPIVRPSLRSCSVGTPPRAIHGPSRLSRHPCRSTHSTEPPFGLLGGRADQKQRPPRRPTGRPDWRQYVYLSKICIAFAFVMRLFRRRESPSQKAERRCCYGGGAAGRRASRDGPWMARGGVPTEQDRSEGRTMGQGLFGYFCGCLTKVPRRKGETLIPVNRERGICTH